jgi:hypothetical protein
MTKFKSRTKFNFINSNILKSKQFIISVNRKRARKIKQFNEYLERNPRKKRLLQLGLFATTIYLWRQFEILKHIKRLKSLKIFSSKQKELQSNLFDNKNLEILAKNESKTSNWIRIGRRMVPIFNYALIGFIGYSIGRMAYYALHKQDLDDLYNNKDFFDMITKCTSAEKMKEVIEGLSTLLVGIKKKLNNSNLDPEKTAELYNKIKARLKMHRALNKHYDKQIAEFAKYSTTMDPKDWDRIYDYFINKIMGFNNDK